MLQINTRVLIFSKTQKLGGDDRNRTCDPLNANQVLSQLSYIPMSISNFRFGISDLFQSKIRNPKSAIEVVAGTGFEPVTFGL
jgi:hypothetical protein